VRKVERLDAIVAQRINSTRSQARSLIMEGRVRVNGTVATKAGQSLRADASVEIEGGRRFVSRGGEKLAHALSAFGIEPRGLRALDVGASTGGFTDCLLQHGAAEVTAVDVGYGQLDWSLRTDPRVRVIERTNFRLLSDDAFELPFDLIVIDASFISVCTMLARAVGYLSESGCIIALVKPQFEAGRERVGARGVVRDPEVHRSVLRSVIQRAVELGLITTGLLPSPLLGPAGNREFLAQLNRGGESISFERIDQVVGEGPA
jgi:23S rRNA (cytidine1920-2'-O)/16S rRNA (cytidine1409-2'-O)-methyltransferase